jgi:hypothetical protein
MSVTEGLYLSPDELNDQAFITDLVVRVILTG